MLPPELHERLHRHGQHHLLDALARFNDDQRASLVRDLERIDLAHLHKLFGSRETRDALPERSRIQPLPRPAPNKVRAFDKLENDIVESGKIAYLVVAGGQGTRLGFDQPKGMFPIGPISKKTLFQLHAEKVLALRRRSGSRIPFLVMTSPATDEATRLFFKRKNYFRLPPQDVWFFCQGTMPALDLETGRLLLEGPGRLGLSPDGHGGTITGLLDSGLLDQLDVLGINTIYYFQVDNPLVNLADFEFIGEHAEKQAQVSSKVLPKSGPMEKVGNFLLVDGRCSMIEYSDLPEEWAHEKDEHGNLKFWAGNPAIHLFDTAFLRRMASEADRMPWHLARKKVPYLDASGRIVEPEKENALKFERFIFDVLPHAERWTIMPIERHEEFAPVKNKEGADSPATAQQLMREQGARWLREIGVEVPEGITVEISPLYALSPMDLAYRGAKKLPKFTKDTYLRDPLY